MIRTLTQEEIEEIIEDSYLPVLVKFGTEWCQPCKILEPILEQLAEEYKDRVLFYYVDADKSKELVDRFEISGVPTVILFDGLVVFKTVGLRNKKFFKGELDKVIEI